MISLDKSIKTGMIFTSTRISGVFERICRLFARRVPSAPQVVMTREDATVIRSFALGDRSLRERAISIHRHYIPSIGVRGTVEQDFMAEVDTPAPDYRLRHRYRQTLLGRDNT
jgi:hypothetical protein